MFEAIYQILFLALSFFPIFSIDNLFETEIANKILSFLLIIIVFSILKLSKRISIINGYIIKDIYSPFFRTLRELDKFRISDIEDLFLNQNEDLYFEITAKIKNRQPFVFKKIPNKNPAQKELELIKAYFKP